MELRGVDPRTSRMLSERSTSWATTPNKVLPGIEPGSLDSKSKMLTNYTTKPEPQMRFELMTFPLQGERSNQLSYNGNYQLYY